MSDPENDSNTNPSPDAGRGPQQSPQQPAEVMPQSALVKLMSTLERLLTSHKSVGVCVLRTLVFALALLLILVGPALLAGLLIGKGALLIGGMANAGTFGLGSGLLRRLWSRRPAGSKRRP